MKKMKLLCTKDGLCYSVLKPSVKQLLASCTIQPALKHIWSYRVCTVHPIHDYSRHRSENFPYPRHHLRLYCPILLLSLFSFISQMSTMHHRLKNFPSKATNVLFLKSQFPLSKPLPFLSPSQYALHRGPNEHIRAPNEPVI